MNHVSRAVIELGEIVLHPVIVLRALAIVVFWLVSCLLSHKQGGISPQFLTREVLRSVLFPKSSVMCLMAAFSASSRLSYSSVRID
jgi:hypothetical protein